MKPIYIIVFVLAFLFLGSWYLQSKPANNLKLLGNPKVNLDKEFKNLGPAPEFVGIDRWLNSDPLTMQQLRGKVVLIDFWTYSCINCIRTLPYVTKWYDTYKDQGLVVIGVHTPEFAFEKITANVETAIKRHKIHYPVAQDNDYATWNAYNNHYWPAKYLIDQTGNIVYTHFGEGNYELTEMAIRKLLRLEGGTVTPEMESKGVVKTPEIYFGLNRLEYIVNEETPSFEEQFFQLPQTLALSTFAVSGFWKFDGEKAVLSKGPGKIKLHFYAGKVYLVARSDKPSVVNISLDENKIGNITIQESQLYTLYDSDQSQDHVLELEIFEPGFEVFTFTFG